MHRKAWLRGIALIVAVGIVAVALWGVLFIVLVGGISAQAPDPFIASGDPCCGHPDTWGEVVRGIAWTLGLVLLDALLVCLAVALSVWAITQGWPRLRRLALLPGGALLAAVLVLAVVLVPQLDEGRTPPDCETFAFTRPAWRSSDEDTQRNTAYGIAHCGDIEGKTPTAVQRLLGRPAGHDERRSGTWWQRYPGLTVYFADDRVVRTDVGIE